MTTCIPTTLTTLTKQPDEIRLFGMDFSNKMEKTETIVTVNSKTVSPIGVTILGHNIIENVVYILCSGGTNNRKYKLTIKITTSSNQELENDGFLKIIEK